MALRDNLFQASLPASGGCHLSLALVKAPFRSLLLRSHGPLPGAFFVDVPKVPSLSQDTSSWLGPPDLLDHIQ